MMRQRFMVMAVGGLWMGSIASGVEALFMDPTGETMATLPDNEARAVSLGFLFPFFGGSEASGINSDRYQESAVIDLLLADQGFPPGATAYRSHFWADLDPSPGGTLLYQIGTEGLAATWQDMGGPEELETMTSRDPPAVPDPAPQDMGDYTAPEGARVKLDSGDLGKYALIGVWSLATAIGLSIWEERADRSPPDPPSGAGGNPAAGATSTTPEASTLILLIVGLLGLGGYVWIRRRRPAPFGQGLLTWPRRPTESLLRGETWRSRQRGEVRIPPPNERPGTGGEV